MASTGADDDLQEIIGEFLVESYENLDQLDRDLVDLEQDPTNRERLGSVFRTIHTIKGTAGFLGFSQLEALSHAAESLLSKLRDGALVLTPELTGALLSAVDAVREMLVAIGNDATEGVRDDSAIISLLETLMNGGSAPAAKPGAAPKAAAKPATPAKPAAPAETAQAEPAPSPTAAPTGSAPTPETAQETATPEAPTPEAPTPEASTPEAPVPPVPTVKAPAAPKAERRAKPRDPEKEAQALADVVESAQSVVTAAAATPTPDTPTEVKSAVTETSIRVDVAVLDKLMNLVGELVLARNQILQHPSTASDVELGVTAQRLNLITSELQEGVMKTRMQAIGTVWARFPRLVRDLAVTCEKHVRLEMEGTETELDRSILEAIRDPMIHLVRNSVDHGIETEADRIAVGKPGEGILKLRSYHEGGYVNIEISDDGGGIDIERVRAKAIAAEENPERRAALAALPDRDVVNLIFAPGFSTADAVTNVSGRGVGMDVVKTHVERAGGTIDVATQAGIGTTFKLRIPLTLAIIPTLIVSCGENRYAIPQVSLVELVRLTADRLDASVENVAGVPVYRLRGRLLPVLDLGTLLGTASAADESGAVTIVVLQAEDRTFGLIVSGVSDTQEIVVKPLDRTLSDIPIFSGATIMGDGRVALILDVTGIARTAGMSQSASTLGSHNEALAAEVVSGRTGSQSLLVLEAGGRNLAISLAAVDRLEKVAADTIEQTGHRSAVQYRGHILPLVWLSEMFGSGGAGDEVLALVVTKVEGHSVGLVADAIIDTVEAVVEVETPPSQLGLRGSAVIAGRVTELVNVDDMVGALAPEILEFIADEAPSALTGVSR